MMTLNEYQGHALKTAVYPGQGTIDGLTYCILKLCGEAGEVAENVGKALRDDDAQITLEREYKIVRELGDVLWYISAAAHELGLTLEDIAQENLRKLADRRDRGVVKGSGDDR